MSISNAFMTFAKEAPEYQTAWGELVGKLDAACALDKKTEALSYLAVMASAGLETGIPFHVKLAKTAGASREEIISSILVGLPAVGNVVIQALPPALAAYDED